MAIVFRPVGNGNYKPGGASNPMGENTMQWDGYNNVPKQTTTTQKPTNTSSGSSGSTGGTTVVYTPPVQQGPSYAEILAEMQRKQQEMIAEMQRKQQEARDQAYKVGAEQQKKNLEYSTGQIDDATNSALQEAYINKMMTLKNLPQTLSAQGLTGGVAESTTAGLYNNYGNSRNALETERLNQLGALQQAYNNNMAQLEAERAGGAAASLSELTPYLLNLVANNPTQLVSLQQGTDTPIQTRSLVWDEDLQKYVYR